MAIGAAAMGFAPTPAIYGDADAPPELVATARRDDSRVEIRPHKGCVVIDITSEFGIDQATLERRGGAWPEIILVRLHLQGLESFKAAWETQTIEWSASSQEEVRQRVMWWDRHHEVPLQPGCPYWTDIRRVDRNNGPWRKERYFEVLLPAKLLERNPRKIELRWIDFYRG